MNKNFIKIITLAVVTLLTYSCSKEESLVIGGYPDSVINSDPTDSPKRNIDESWGSHTQTIYRQYLDKNLAVYYDNDVKRPLEWPFQFLKDTWKSVNNTYGNFGNENRLYAVYHNEATSTPYVGTIFDAASKNRSIIDIPLDGYEMQSKNIDNSLKAITKIVENSSYGLQGSPTHAIWGNSFSEIFVFDILTNLQMQTDADRVLAEYNKSSYSFPKAGTFWFRDWYYPIYKNYGGSNVLGNFFKLVAQKYPNSNSEFDHDMNMGEFVHFFSGATGIDLQPMAENVFGWSDDKQEQLLQARADFPTLNYPFDPVVDIKDLTEDSKITVSKDNGNGAQGNEGSLKLIDNNLNNKFLVGGLDPSKINFWMQQELVESTIVNKYNITSGNDAPERDARNWELVGSNDGTTWKSLDTRTDQIFSGRNQTREFTITNSEAFKYYRINITANYGSDAIQISEWRQYFIRK